MKDIFKGFVIVFATIGLLLFSMAIIGAFYG
jgi:hypothetical protein